jgi:hypothetical protein
MKRFVRLFALAICAGLLLTAGWCERYDRKSRTKDGVRHYYDSVLREERLRKDSVWKANRKQWEREHYPDDADSEQ